MSTINIPSWALDEADVRAKAAVGPIMEAMRLFGSARKIWGDVRHKYAAVDMDFDPWTRNRQEPYIPSQTKVNTLSAHASLVSRTHVQEGIKLLDRARVEMRGQSPFLGGRTRIIIQGTLKNGSSEKPIASISIDGVHPQNNDLCQARALITRLRASIGSLIALESALSPEPAENLWGWNTSSQSPLIAADTAAHAWLKKMAIEYPDMPFDPSSVFIPFSQPFAAIDPNPVLDRLADIRRQICPGGDPFPVTTS